MRLMRTFQLLLLISVLCPITAVFSEPYADEHAQSIFENIHAEFDNSKDNRTLIGTRGNTLNQLYQKMQRTKTDPSQTELSGETLESEIRLAAEQTEMKWMMSHWRMRAAKEIIAHLEQAAIIPSTALNRLRQTRAPLDEKQVQTLAAIFETKPEHIPGFVRLVADFGEDSTTRTLLESWESRSLTSSDWRLRMGPPPMKNVKPYRKNGTIGPWGWVPGNTHRPHKAVADAGDYLFPDPSDPHTIQYKGLTLKTGDFFVSDLRLKHDGTMTGLTNERSLGEHSGQFIVLQVPQEDGSILKVPGVWEIHQDGNRFVKLSNFLGREHTYHNEVYRPSFLTRQFQDALNTVYLESLNNKEPFKHNFEGAAPPLSGVFPNTRKDHKHNKNDVTCVGLGEVMCYRAFAELQRQEEHKKGNTEATRENVTVDWERIFPTTAVRDDALDNIKNALGVEAVKYAILPSDIARSPLFDYVGTVDNGNLDENLARFVLMGTPTKKHTVARSMTQKQMRTNRLPKTEQIVERAFVGVGRNDLFPARIQPYMDWSKPITAPFTRWLTRRVGHNPDAIVSTASKETIAFYELSQKYLARAVDHLAKNSTSLRMALDSNEPLILSQLEDSANKDVKAAMKASGVTEWSVERIRSPFGQDGELKSKCARALSDIAH